MSFYSRQKDSSYGRRLIIAVNYSLIKARFNCVLLVAMKMHLPSHPRRLMSWHTSSCAFHNDERELCVIRQIPGTDWRDSEGVRRTYISFLSFLSRANPPPIHVESWPHANLRSLCIIKEHDTWKELHNLGRKKKERAHTGEFVPLAQVGAVFKKKKKRKKRDVPAIFRLNQDEGHAAFNLMACVFSQAGKKFHLVHGNGKENNTFLLFHIVYSTYAKILVPSYSPTTWLIKL